MIVSHWYHIPTWLSLGFIALVLTLVDRHLVADASVFPRATPPVQEH